LFRGQLTKKQRFGPKLAGVWAREASEKMWDPLRIFATVEANNFKCGTQIGFGTSLPKKTFKKWDPILIPATVEGSNFKFGTQLGFGTSLPKNNV